MKARIFFTFYLILALLITANTERWTSNRMVSWDRNGYYVYIPALFIHGDISDLRFMKQIDDLYHPSDSVKLYGITEFPGTHRQLTKYSLGVAIFETPFFLAAHSFANTTHRYRPDGYSAPYQIGIALSAIVFTVLGLYLLYLFLLLYFGESTVLITVAMVGLGTNLYTYCMFEAGMSHNYLFFLFAAMLLLTALWYRDGKWSHALMLGLVAGLMVITRPVDVLGLIIPVFWPVAGMDNFSKRLQLFKSRGRQLMLAFVVFLLVLLIQIGFWKHITGHWIYYSYGDEGFDFLHPHIWAGLFSYKKGWFVYTPVAFFAFSGLIALWKTDRKMNILLSCFLALFIYVTFSWTCWFYGGGFSARPMIDILPVVSIPLAALIQVIQQSGKPLLKLVFAIICCFFITLNIFQSYQMYMGVINWEYMNRAYYWRVFGKIEASEDDKALMNE